MECWPEVLAKIALKLFLNLSKSLTKFVMIKGKLFYIIGIYFTVTQNKQKFLFLRVLRICTATMTIIKKCPNSFNHKLMTI